MDILFLEGLKKLEEDSKRVAEDRRERIKDDTMQYMAYLNAMKEEARLEDDSREEM